MSVKSNKWGGYVRVSDTHGRREASESRKQQRERFEKWAEFAGVTLAAVEEDLDVSGGKAVEDRKIAKLVRRCERQELDGIVTRRVDRMGRDAAEVTALAKRMRECGAALVGIEDGVDTRTESGTLVLNILAGIAEHELERIRSTWATYQRRAHEAGKRVGAAPRGYSREAGKLIPNEEAASVRRVFELRAEGAPWSRVSEETGIPESSCQKIIGTRTYLGELHRQGLDTLTGTHEALVTEDLFYSANAQAGKRAPRSGESLSAKLLLAGLCRCSSCGYTMQANIDKRAKHPRAFYYCTGKSRKGGKCKAPAFVYADVLHERVEGIVLDYLSMPSGAIADALEASGRIERAEASVVEAQGAYDAIADNTRLAGRDKAHFDRLVDAAWTDLETSKLDLSEARSASALLDGLTGGDLAGYSKLTEIGDRRRVLGHLLDRIIVRRGDTPKATLFGTRVVWNGNVLAEPAEGFYRAPEIEVARL
jgi:DNA invertase Pin-like site-specific DNA recombinase